MPAGNWTFVWLFILTIRLPMVYSTVAASLNCDSWKRSAVAQRSRFCLIRVDVRWRSMSLLVACSIFLTALTTHSKMESPVAVTWTRPFGFSRTSIRHVPMNSDWLLELSSNRTRIVLIREVNRFVALWILCATKCCKRFIIASVGILTFNGCNFFLLGSCWYFHMTFVHTHQGCQFSLKLFQRPPFLLLKKCWLE